MAIAVATDIYSRIRTEVDAAGPDESPYTIVQSILRMVSKDDLAPLVMDQIERIRRERVRSLERGTFVRLIGRPAVPPPASAAPSAREKVEHLRGILRESFALHDGTRVEWGRATVKQHMERMSALSEQRNGLDRTISYHSRAVALLKETGAECLDDIVS